jgi:hypothetical protein
MTPEDLAGGGVAAGSLMLARELVGRLVPAAIPGAAEVQALRDRVLHLEHEVAALKLAATSEREARLRDRDALDAASREINRAAGSTAAMLALLDGQERLDAPRRH